MKNLVLGAILKSKKFWYAIGSIVIPLIVSWLGVDEQTASNVFYAAIALVIGQGIADSGK